MDGLTLGIAVVAACMVLFMRPVWAIPIYVAVLTWYPTYLSVKLGTLDFTVPRIVILAIFLKIILAGNITSRFRWIWLDYLIIIASVTAVVSNMFTVPMEEMMEYHSGQQFDTVMVYFAARLLITSRAEYLKLLKALLFISIPLAILGAYQCVTFHNPMGFLKQYHAWAAAPDVVAARWNLCRADLTFGHPIMFGLYFAIIGPLYIGLWHFVRRSHRPLLACGIILALLGLASSMSSGPQLAGVGLFFALILFPYRKYWRILLAGLILLMVLVEVGSNRHWYYVASSYLAFNADTAYGRCKLVEHALGGGMSGRWLLGFGFTDPGWWEALHGSYLKGTDITNHYILVLVRCGLVGLIPFIAVISAGCVQLRRAFVAASTKADRWLVWCVLASMVGILLSMFSVSLFGQPTNLFFLLLGLCGTMSGIVAEPASSVTGRPGTLVENQIELYKLSA